MTNNNDFRNDNHSVEDNHSDILGIARAKFAEFRNSMLEQKGESKAKMQKAKLLLSEAKSIEKVKKSKEKELDSVVKKELKASAKADKALEKINNTFNKTALKRQTLESIALNQAIKREDIEKNLEVLNLQEEVLSQDIDLTNQLLKNTRDAKDAKIIEIDMKNSKYARAVLSDAHTEADKMNAKIEDELQLKRIKLENILSSADDEGIMQVEEEKQRMIDAAEAVYISEREEILSFPDEDMPDALRQKLLKEAEKKLKEEIEIANGIAEAMLKDFALDKLAAAREAVSSDISKEKTMILEKISAISEEERFRIAKERKETLNRIQNEKDEGVKAIIADTTITEEDKETAIKQFIKEKQIEAKEAIRQYKYEEKVRVLAGKTEIKIAFKQIHAVQKDIADLKYRTITDADTELESLDLLINETATKAEVLSQELDIIRKERDVKEKAEIQEAGVVVDKKLDAIDEAYEDIREFNTNYLKEAHISMEQIKATDNIEKLQEQIDLAKQFALQEKMDMLVALREKQVARALAKGQIAEVIESRQKTLTEEEKRIIAEKKQEYLNSYDGEEDLDAKIELTKNKLKAEDFLGDLLSLEDLAELEALEEELSLLESEKQKELLSLENELRALEETHEIELERLKEESEQLKTSKRDALNQLQAEVAALDEERQKELSEIEKD